VRIAVMGTGGVGGYFGGLLARAGEAVAFVARGEHLRAIRAGGLAVESVDGDFTVAAPATADPVQVPALIGPVDLVLFCVKLYDTEAAARALGSALAPHTAVLSLQNGVAKDARLGETLGHDRILGGLCHVFVAVERPGVVRHAGGGALAFGELDGRPSERARAFLGAAEKAGIRVELVSDIGRRQWEKYLIFQRKMDTPRDIGARVWDFDAHKLVDDGLFSDTALATAAQAIRETGAITEVPPLSAWVDKRFLPVRWKR
jgi:2-dehydropantoate 2-reductase